MSSRYNLSREIVCWCMRLLCVTRIFRLKSAKRRRRRKESVRILFNRKKKTYVSVHNSIIFFLSMSPYRNRKRWTKNMLISQASRFFFFLSSILRKILTCGMWGKYVTLSTKKNSRSKSINSPYCRQRKRDDCCRWSFVRFFFFVLS